MFIGCVNAKNYEMKNQLPVNQKQAEQDTRECNEGWQAWLVLDIFITVGIASIIHYISAVNCMDEKGYKEIIKVEQPLPVESVNREVYDYNK